MRRSLQFTLFRKRLDFVFRAVAAQFTEARTLGASVNACVALTLLDRGGP